MTSLDDDSSISQAYESATDSSSSRPTGPCSPSGSGRSAPDGPQGRRPPTGLRRDHGVRRLRACRSAPPSSPSSSAGQARRDCKPKNHVAVSCRRGRFRAVNESFGLRVADELLAQVARRPRAPPLPPRACWDKFAAYGSCTTSRIGQPSRRCAPRWPTLRHRGPECFLWCRSAWQAIRRRRQCGPAPRMPKPRW